MIEMVKHMIKSCYVNAQNYEPNDQIQDTKTFSQTAINIVNQMFKSC